MQVGNARVGSAALVPQRVQFLESARTYSSKTEVRAQASQAQTQLQPEVEDPIPSYVNPSRCFAVGCIISAICHAETACGSEIDDF